MRFPEWVPEELCRIWREMDLEEKAGHPRRERERELLRRLMTDPRMKRVWSEIAKNRRLRPDGTLDERVYSTIFFQAHVALDAHKWERRTRKEKAAKYLGIAKAAREFAEAVKHSQLDTTPYQWYPDDVIEDLLSKMRPEFAEGTFCLIEPLPGYPDFIWQRIQCSDGGYGFRPFAISLLDFFERCLRPHSHPTMSALAEASAKKAHTLAGKAMIEPRILSKLKYNNSQEYDLRRIAFIRVMARCFVRECESILRRTLATFSAVALEDNTIILATVKAALKGYVKSK